MQTEISGHSTRSTRFSPLLLPFIFSFSKTTNRLNESNFNDDDSDDDEEDLRQRRYSLQLSDSKGFRRSKGKVSAQPQLESEDENELPSDLLSRQNTM